MKREFLESLDLGEGVKLPKAAIDAVMAENGRDIEAKNNALATLTTERDGLKTQLVAAHEAIQSYKDMDIDGIKAKAGEWEARYNSDTQALKDQLEAARYGFAVKEATAGLRFSSESARKTFVVELTAQKLPLQEGKLLGSEDFAKTYKEKDPGAFLSENDERTPVAVRGGGDQRHRGRDPPAGNRQGGGGVCPAGDQLHRLPERAPGGRRSLCGDGHPHRGHPRQDTGGGPAEAGAGHRHGAGQPVRGVQPHLPAVAGAGVHRRRMGGV